MVIFGLTFCLVSCMSINFICHITLRERSFSVKLKVVEIQCSLFLLRPPGFSNPVKELFSWHSRRVVDLPNSPLISRELLRNDCSYTIVKFRNVVPQIFQLRLCHLMYFLVRLVCFSETRCSDFRGFSVREKKIYESCTPSSELYFGLIV